MDDWENVTWNINKDGNWQVDQTNPVEEGGRVVWIAVVEEVHGRFNWVASAGRKGDRGSEGSLTAAKHAAIASIQKMMEA